MRGQHFEGTFDSEVGFVTGACEATTPPRRSMSTRPPRQGTRVVLVGKDSASAGFFNTALGYQTAAAFLRAETRGLLHLAGAISVSTSSTPSVKKAQVDAVGAYPIQLSLMSSLLSLVSKVARISEYLFPNPLLADASDGGVPLLKLDDLRGDNVRQAKEFIIHYECEILLSYGAPVVPSELLGLPTIAAINMHTGYLPGHGGGSTELSFFLDETQAMRLPCACAIHLMVPDVDAGDLLAVHVFDTPTTCIGYMLRQVPALELTLETISSLTAECVAEMRVPQSGGRLFLRRNTFERIDEIARRGALRVSIAEALEAVATTILYRFRPCSSLRPIRKLTASELGRVSKIQ